MNEYPNSIAWAESVDIETPFVKVVGGGGTGKSLSLAKRAKYLVESGISTDDIIILSTSRSAVDAMGACLASIGAPQDIRVTTLEQYLVQMLAQDEVKAITGRNPRILADFEVRILMEDMKVCGLKNKRLREMLKFFYKEMSELGDEKEDFILDTEESDIYETLLANLRFRNAMLIEELSNIACKFVRDNPQVAAPFVRQYVLVDDFQNLNKASQMVVEMLTGTSLMLTGCLNEQVATTEPYPAPQSFRTFELTHDNVAVIRLTAGLRCPDRITAMANSLVVNGGLSKNELVELGNDAPCEVRFAEFTHPNDEFMGIARYIKHRLADNSHIIHGGDIFVAVPNAVWSKALAKVLEANHIKTDQVMSHHALKGDPRSLDKSHVLQAYTRLNLAADPEDVTAWRTWCGLGDFLTNSNHWFRLEKYAQTAGIGVLEALDRAEMMAEGELFAGANVLVERYREGCRFIASVQGKQGFALLNACAPVRGEEPPEGFKNLVAPVSGGETAAELLERANGRMEARFSDADAVRIGLLEMSCGMSFDTVIFMGCVEGYYPNIITLGVEYDDERNDGIRKQERREWYSAMTKARYAFVASTVQKDEANTAAALGMYAHRIRMEDGKGMAVLAPSPYLEEMGDEAPGYEARL